MADLWDGLHRRGVSAVEATLGVLAATTRRVSPSLCVCRRRATFRNAAAGAKSTAMINVIRRYDSAQSSSRMVCISVRQTEPLRPKASKNRSAGHRDRLGPRGPAGLTSTADGPGVQPHRRPLGGAYVNPQGALSSARLAQRTTAKTTSTFSQGNSCCEANAFATPSASAKVSTVRSSSARVCPSSFSPGPPHFRHHRPRPTFLFVRTLPCGLSICRLPVYSAPAIRRATRDYPLAWQPSTEQDPQYEPDHGWESKS